MFKVVRIKTSDGGERSLFTGCTETGYSAKELLTMPGAYDTCTGTSSGAKLFLCQLTGAIGAYNTKLFGLCVEDSSLEVRDLSGTVRNMLNMPSTAMSTLLRSMSEEMREDAEQAIEAIHFYEKVNEGSKVCLPEEALSLLPEEMATAMKSARPTYNLKDTDNQEIFQKSYDAEFGVMLPTLAEIHDGETEDYETLDVIRALMPYRRPGSPQVYESIYHTPYFRVGMNAAMVPPHLKWIDGYASNDTLDIQPNERHMQSNMYTLYCADVARYVQELVTGIFFTTEYGTRFTRLRTVRERDVIDRLVSELQAGASLGEGKPTVSCNITSSEVDELWSGGWDVEAVGRAFKAALVIEDGLLDALIESQHVSRRTIPTNNQLFTISLSDEQSSRYTDMLIQHGYITYELRNFYVKLCQRAYAACWGHTGAVRAVPALIDQSRLGDADKMFTRFLQARVDGRGIDKRDFRGMYVDTYNGLDYNDLDDESKRERDELEQGLGDDGGEGLGVAFDYYLTKTTYQRLASGESFDMNTLMGRRDSESESDRVKRLEGSMDTNSRRIERWRLVPADSNLAYFLTTVFDQTADINIFIHAFLKLCRWGERRPKSIVFPEHAEIRKVFDLGLGKETDNTTIVNEDDLVLVNGCEYSLVGLMNSTSNRDIDPAYIVGFVLKKDYGNTTREYISSWSDLAEMVEKGDIKIGEFKVGAPVDTSHLIEAESFEKKSFEVYESDSNIAKGLELKVRGRELSDVIQLTKPSITSDRQYIKATARDTILDLAERRHNNLYRYITLLKAFYAQYGERLDNIRTTMDLQELALCFAELKKSGPAAKVEHNAQAASNTLKSLNLDGGKVEYVNTPLTGKFILVNDSENYSIKDDTWDPIQFSDHSLSVLNTRYNIVLLLCKTSDCWLLCRKDITMQELDIQRTNGKAVPSSVKYGMFREAITKLLDGGSVKLQGLPLKLHVSAMLQKK